MQQIALLLATVGHLAAHLRCRMLHRHLHQLALDRAACVWLRLCTTCDAGHAALAQSHLPQPARPTVRRASQKFWRLG
jgi:hypothetical protein